MKLTGFEIQGGAVRRVLTGTGSIEAEMVIAGPGPWAPEIWRMLEPMRIQIKLPDGQVAERPIGEYWKLQEGHVFTTQGMRAQWEEAGALDARERGGRRAKEILESHEPEPIPAEVDARIRAELDIRF